MNGSAKAISEREFKVASDITSGERTRLLPRKAEKLLFLKYNLRFIGYKSGMLPARVEKSSNDCGENVSDGSDDD